jgi:hypothetical protein
MVIPHGQTSQQAGSGCICQLTDGIFTAKDHDGSWSLPGDQEPRRGRAMTRQLTDLLSFRRIADIPFDTCMAALDSEQLTGHDGELPLGKSLLRGPAERDHRSGTCRIEVRLARGALRPPARMRLDIDQWSATAIAFELIPCQRVRPSAAYFAAGHRLLDSLIGTLRARVTVQQRPDHDDLHAAVSVGSPALSRT